MRTHSKSDIEAALRYAEQNGWRVELGGSHAWGKIYCPYNDKECRCGTFCISSVWSTPKNAGNHGKIYCPYNDKECRCGTFCISSVWSTPKNAGNHAKQIRRVVDNCTNHKNLDDPCEQEE